MLGAGLHRERESPSRGMEQRTRFPNNQEGGDTKGCRKRAPNPQKTTEAQDKGSMTHSEGPGWDIKGQADKCRTLVSGTGQQRRHGKAGALKLIRSAGRIFDLFMEAQGQGQS